MFSEEPDVPWPTCVDSKDPWSPAVFFPNISYLVVTECANPTSQETTDIVLDSAISADVNYTTVIK